MRQFTVCYTEYLHCDEYLKPGCINPGHQVTVLTELCAVCYCCIGFEAWWCKRVPVLTIVNLWVLQLIT
jgi:hypothetical protein